MKNKEKKKIKKVKAKKLKHKKSPKRNLGKKIEVKVIKEEKPENILGSVMVAEQIKSRYENLDFSDLGIDESIPDVENNNSNDQVEPVLIQESIEENIEQPQEEIIDERDDDYQVENIPEPFGYLSLRQKNIIMYIAVVSIMSVLVVFWFFSIKQSLSQGLKNYNLINSQQSNSLKQELGEIKEDFNNITNQVQSKTQDLNNFTNKVKEGVAEYQIKNNVLEQLKDRLENSNTNQNINSPK
jgi:methyl-accepting chemotaxis protein